MLELTFYPAVALLVVKAVAKVCFYWAVWELGKAVLSYEANQQGGAR